jgi:predicted DNA-binding protein (UPF0251 family)
MSEGRPDKTASIEAVSQSDAVDKLNVSRSAVQRAGKVQQYAMAVAISCQKCAIRNIRNQSYQAPTDG